MTTSAEAMRALNDIAEFFANEEVGGYLDDANIVRARLEQADEMEAERDQWKAVAGELAGACDTIVKYDGYADVELPEEVYGPCKTALPRRSGRRVMSQFDARPCCNCGAEITACNGYVKVGDLMNPDGTMKMGIGSFETVRELCGMCGERYHWGENDELVPNVLPSPAVHRRGET